MNSLHTNLKVPNPLFFGGIKVCTSFEYVFFLLWKEYRWLITERNKQELKYEVVEKLRYETTE